ncbi:MAG TPA: hypothetical protein VFU55_10660 [Terracidiphilus sp.]|nr:hypothetical protein [Terracidiphilus sp.]
MRVTKSEMEINLRSELVSEMTVDRIQFKPEWVHQKGWKVVPVETGMSFSAEDIKNIVAGLQRFGLSECFAIATEELDPLPICYVLEITEEDFREFNRNCGLFWFFLTDEQQSWAISCNNNYNLFAGKPELLESMLGKPIEEARAEYLSFATALAKEPDDPLVRMAKHYADL